MTDQMPSPKILIVEDEPPVREMLRFLLKQHGMTVIEAEDAAQAGREIIEKSPDMVVLDWMLPGQSGVDFARDLKQRPETRNLPIIMLTARAEEDDKVKGLEVGADDYVTKPFSPRELLARVKAVLRRVSALHGEDKVEVKGLSLDPVSHRVLADESDIDLGPTEFRLLHFFMTHPERVYSRAQILDQVWGFNVYVEERTVDVHIRRLRKALEIQGYDRFVQTVRGTGYRFSDRI
jgi:two-component system phosphate regulon response regulator PhoB